MQCRRHLALAVFAVACSPSALLAQETTSSIRGIVTNEGLPIAGAVVTVTHLPSGTVVTSQTGSDGTFSTSGLRVGGPFRVRVVAKGLAPAEVNDLNLIAGQPLRLPVALDARDIVVAGRRTPRAVTLSSGPVTVRDREAIEGVASVSRDLRDVVRRDPFATLDPTNSRGVQIAGQNSRLNRFSVDGLRFSDNFGLNNGGLPTARGPVPLDAIEQLSVKVAPYDISEGDFQGGAINVVLRSGGNRVEGSGFYTYTDDSLTGDRTRDTRVALDFQSKNYGGFLSGPIIRDKLFLALSYERLDETTPQAVALAGSANPVPNLTQAQVDQIDAIAQQQYKYATGGVFNSVAETDEKYTAKLDWNLAAGQRLSLTYIHNEGTQGQTPGFNSISPVSPALSLTSNDYLRPEIIDSGVAQLNSDWSDNFHTELRGNYRRYDLKPVAFGATPFAQFQICLDPTAANDPNTTAAAPTTCRQGSAARPGSARLYIGPDQFRQANLVKTEQYGADLVARWEYGSHSLKLNAAWNHIGVVNLFVQNATGNYYFDSIADFQAGRASSLALGGSITGNLDDIYASFAYDQFTAGVQDSWDVTPRLNMVYGVRTDLYAMRDAPPLNTNFVARYGMPNTYTFKGRQVIQPRFGVTWKASDRLTLRGGAGLFAGGTPDVFLGNSFSVPGVFNNAITIQRTATGCNVAAALCSAALDAVDGRTFNPAVLDYLRTNTSSIASASVNAMARDYAPASTWKTSVSVDYAADLGPFGDGWNFGGDFYYGFVKDAPIYTDLRSTRVGTAPDGRPIYANLAGGTLANSDLFLSNTHRGHSLIAVARFDKRWRWGLAVGASYTFQDVTDISAMTSSAAFNAYGQSVARDPNIAAYGTSIYEIRNSWKFNIDLDHAFVGDYKTRFSLFGELRSGLPYSLTMNDPSLINGRSAVFGTTGLTNRYLLYVPNVASITADSLVSYDSEKTFSALRDYVVANRLKQGRIVDKGSKRSPNWFKIDLHVDQELPVPLVSRARFKLFADIENVLNLINKDWGSLRQVVFPNYAPLVNVACAVTSGTSCVQYRYSNFQDPRVVNQTRFSLWGIRVGAKVGF